jgi:polar amino acid transport system permease protein
MDLTNQIDGSPPRDESLGGAAAHTTSEYHRRVVARPRYGRHLAALAVTIVAASLLWSLWSNPNVGRDVVGDYLFDSATLSGVAVTLELTALAMLIGLVGAVLLALMRLSGNKLLTAIAYAYIWFFRGTPLLVQIIFWGFLGALYNRLTLGIPFTHVVFFSTDTSAVIGAFMAALLGLGLNEAAYASELVRAGILSVDHGQTEAAYSVGLTPLQTMRTIVIPQAMRVIIPPMGNETIGMLKTTALVSVIAGHDLLTNLQTIYSQSFQVIPLLIVASIWYLALTTVFSIGQYFLERHYGRGVAGSKQRPVRTGSMWDRLSRVRGAGA